MSTTPEDALDRLHNEVLTDIKSVVSEAVKAAVTEQCMEFKFIPEKPTAAKLHNR